MTLVAVKLSNWGLRMNLFKCGAAIAALFVSAGASGASVTWTLQDVVFDSGATATGSFDFDADNFINPYSGFDITITGWEPDGIFGPQDVDPFVYTTGNASASGYSVVSFVDQNGGGLVCPAAACTRRLTLWFDSPLTNEGGTVSLTFLDRSAEAMTALGYAVNHSITSGTVTTVPVPGAVWLFGSALGLLGWIRRKTA